MGFDLILKNGLLVDPVNDIHGKMDIGIKEGKIGEIGKNLTNSDRIIDVSNLVVMPGVIDMHVHTDNLLGGGHIGFHMVAETGVTTMIDFAGPPDEIYGNMKNYNAYGLNVGVLETVRPNEENGDNPSFHDIEQQLENALKEGALGFKLLGGHFPLTPDATERAIDIANRNKVIMAIHSGTTRYRSNIEGMRESIELANGRPIVLAHINAYCRGKVRPYLHELDEAFTMLRENPNIFAESHLASMNGTYGKCLGDTPVDVITINCLESFGYNPTKEGMIQGIKDGVIRVIMPQPYETVLIEREEAFEYWMSKDTDTMVSFPANLPTSATACALEKNPENGEFLLKVTSTDGGGIPRNNLIGRILHLYNMGYMSLEDVITKVSINPAKIFALKNKGHLSVGADADITVLDLERSKAVMSFALGRMIMNNGTLVGTGGTMLVTEYGVKCMQKNNLNYDVVDISDSYLYKRNQ